MKLLLIFLFLYPIVLSSENIEIRARRLSPLDGKYIYENLKLNSNSTALIVMDSWITDWSKIYRGSNYKTNLKLLNLLIEKCRNQNIFIIYASHGNTISSIVAPKKGDLVLAKEYNIKELKMYFVKKQINTLLYAGYATNMCILTRPIGILNMREHLNIPDKFNIILFRDITLAVETAHSAKTQEAKNGVITLLELNNIYTSTLEDLK